jgi:hypothetical protein
MKALRRIVAVLLVALGTAAGTTNGHANPPTSETWALATELFDLTFTEAIGVLNNRVVDNVWPDTEAALRRKNPKIDAATLMELRGEFARLRLAHMRELLQTGPATYVRYFTPDEMREALAFYRTPTGRKVLRTAPNLVSDLLAMTLPAMGEIGAKSSQSFMELLRKRGYLN